MGVELILEGETLTARLRGEIDHHSGGPLREAIDRRAAQARPRELVLDFSGVTFMDSSGIGLILGRYRWMHDLGGTVRVVQIDRRMEPLLTLSGVDKLVRVERQPPEKEEDPPKEEVESREIFSDSAREVHYHGK